VSLTVFKNTNVRSSTICQTVTEIRKIVNKFAIQRDLFAVPYFQSSRLYNRLSYRGWPKNSAHFCTLYNFIKYWTIFKLFPPESGGKILIIISLKIQTHLKCVATLPCEFQCLKVTTENKTFVTTHFKKLTTEYNAFISSVIVESNCHILQFLHQIFNVAALVLDDALLICVVTQVVLCQFFGPHSMCATVKILTSSRNFLTLSPFYNSNTRQRNLTVPGPLRNTCLWLQHKT